MVGEGDLRADCHSAAAPVGGAVVVQGAVEVEVAGRVDVFDDEFVVAFIIVHVIVDGHQRRLDERCCPRIPEY